MEFKSKVKRFQAGGAVDNSGAPAGAPAEQDPMAQLLSVAAQAVQTQNCEAAMAVCQTLVQLAQGQAQQAAPAQEEPTFAKRGGKLQRIR